IPDAEADYIMPLSGGRDSRHILLELLRQGHRPRLCVTAEHDPYDWGGDVPYAARLASELGLEHAAVRPGPPVAAEQRKNRLTSYTSTMHAWFLSVVDALSGQTNYTYEGLPGGTILERRFVTRRVRELSEAERWDELAAGMGKKLGGRPGYLSLLTCGMREQLPAERGVGRSRAELERHLHADDPFMSFRILNRTMRELTLTPNAMLSAVSAVYTPYMDPDFMAFGMSIPPEHIDRAFHDDLLAAAYPEVAHVPFRPLRRPRPSRRFVRGLNRELLRLVWRESDGSLVDRSALMRRSAVGVVRGDDWFTSGRRFSQLTYLIQLERITRRIDGASKPKTRLDGTE
ncbi:MAG: hypothetical protein ACC726_13415, partial [Chloroflexota bacterium]